MNIASNESHCGGCGSSCAAGKTCENVENTTMCAMNPVSTSGRCRCDGSAQCPRSQSCRTGNPYPGRCEPCINAPLGNCNTSECAPGQTGVSTNNCPNYCKY